MSTTEIRESQEAAAFLVHDLISTEEQARRADLRALTHGFGSGMRLKCQSLIKNQRNLDELVPVRFKQDAFQTHMINVPRRRDI